MNDRFKRLADVLLEKNDHLSSGQALSWVEGMWDDFAVTRAKAGHEYNSPEITEKVILEWINLYGPRLHNFASDNPKFSHLLRDDHLKH